MKFAVATPLLALLMLGLAPGVPARAADDGKYNKRKYFNGNHGKYVHKNEGDYVEDLDRYRYVHYDDGDRGRYIHVHVPYDGGYGPYEGGHEPYRNPPYDATGLYAYVQRPKNDTCLRLLEQYSNTCSDSIIDSPFKTNEYDIRKPELYLEYGAPYSEFNYGASTHRVKQTSASAALDPRVSNFPGTAYLPALETPAAPKTDSMGRTGKIDTESVTLTTSRSEETLHRLATEGPNTKSSRSTSERPRVADESSTASASATVVSISTPQSASVEQQLQQCRIELDETKRKLSYSGMHWNCFGSPTDDLYGGRCEPPVNSGKACCFGFTVADAALAILGCVAAQRQQDARYNDGRYYPELYQGKYSDGKYHPDSSGAYHPDDSGKYSGKYVPYVDGKYGQGGQGGAGGAGSGFGGQGGRGGSGGAGRGGSGAGSGSRKGAGSGSGSGAKVAVPIVIPAVPPKVSVPAQKVKLSGSGSGSGSGWDRIKEQVKEYNQDGYYYRYLTEQEAQVAETGRIEDRNTDSETLRAKGFFEYVGDDGVRYRVDYNADENGFVPRGAHLPTPPPIPEAIARALEYVRKLQQ
ncbi:uncharacterized protein LOC131679545 [Topomyia yanbarensis]|uniref:uncharacterized protein LOC131679545 n=1 Tax=Topomyia yanbarensis TaxID=2498891 RepID=UPI00273BC271|nr:uncharacterized protein LOC131679545 [Topomyia yanbarensis]